MTDDMPTTADTIQNLTRPEHLLVWALRAIAIGHDDCPLLGQIFERACGPMGVPALGAYGILVKTIGMIGRRRLRVHVPGCPCVSLDEMAIVGVVAAGQQSLTHGDETLLRLRLQFLVESQPAESLIFTAQAVARMLEAGGCRLPTAPSPKPAAYEGRPNLTTVH